MKTAPFRIFSGARYGAALAMALGLLAGAAVPAAQAASLTLSGSTTATCTYSGASIDAAGNMTITTTSECLKTPDALAFASTPTSLTTNGTINVTVTRANPGTASVTGTVSAAGSCTGGGAVAFGGSSTTSSPATIAINGAATEGTCTISLVADAPANLGTPSSFTVNVTNTPPPPNDTLAFSAATGSVQVGLSATVNVTRSGTNYSGLSATVNGGGCTVSPTIATFTGTSTAAVPITVTAPGTATICNVTLSGASAGATIGTPSTFALTVTEAPVTPPPAPGCSTSANVTYDIRSGNKAIVLLGSGQTAAVKFFQAGDSKQGAQLTTVHTTEGAFPPDTQVAISTCPGDFVVTNSACGSTVGGETTTTEWNTILNYPWICKLDPTKTYYLNVRSPSCVGTCGWRVGM